MKKDTLFNYIKLATVLLINVVPISTLISISKVEYSEFGDTLALLITLFFLIAFNLWALIIFYFTKHIERPWLREISFYVLLFSFIYIPLIMWLATLFS